MQLVFFVHPDFLNHKSMPKFARMLSEGMKLREHQVEIWSPKPRAFNIPAPRSIKKWLGYLDQYVIFPRTVKRNLKKVGSDTLYIFADNALGPWVPLVSDKPNVVHCHDFLAQRSAKDEIVENRTGWTGKVYQRMIRKGLQKGKNFISVSKKTKEDLHHFISNDPSSSQVVYNGFHQSFSRQDQGKSILAISKKTNLDLKSGYLLHVGGNTWYKNRKGVLEIFEAFRKNGKSSLPLLMIGEPPTEELLNIQANSKFKHDIHWLTDIEDDYVKLAYSGASVFLFPSLAEGFGWPIAEAMACGGPVITTDEAPMTEVAGDAGFYIPRRPAQNNKVDEWAKEGARLVERILALPRAKKELAIQHGIKNAQRFETDKTLDIIESIYQNILNNK